jgi:hypothetical protein
MNQISAGRLATGALLVVVALQVALVALHATVGPSGAEAGRDLRQAFRSHLSSEQAPASAAGEVMAEPEQQPALWTRTDVNLQSLCASPPPAWRDACGRPASAQTRVGARDGAGFGIRVVQYNTFRCATRGTLPFVLDWLAARGAGYASLNELNGLNQSTFAAAARARGFAHAALLEASSGYHVGFLSAADPLVGVTRHTKGFKHGVLHAKVASGLHFLVAHLTPGAPAVRLGRQRATRWSLHTTLNGLCY